MVIPHLFAVTYNCIYSIGLAWNIRSFQIFIFLRKASEELWRLKCWDIKAITTTSYMDIVIGWFFCCWSFLFLTPIPFSSKNFVTWCHTTLQQRPYTAAVCVFTIQTKHFLPKNNPIPIQHLVCPAFSYSPPHIDSKLKKFQKFKIRSIKPNWQS